MSNIELANMLFPNINNTVDHYDSVYPARNLSPDAKVTRLGPSPTGFIHLGNLYGAFVDERLAHQSGGTFYLRIEDTDDKRLVEGAVDAIIDSLDFFGIHFDEGATKAGDTGLYGPYSQSQRVEMYQTFVKDLIVKGLAYPCFMAEEEIQEIRTSQEEEKKTPGIYGTYAHNRSLTNQQIKDFIDQGKPYVIRLKSKGNPENPATISVEDGIRGVLTMPENFQDVVILKANGVPTYHFAHACDDHFMGTTHVVRGEEWLSSLAIHVELFETLGFNLPIYCHTAVLMKIDENGNRRKLSKRKDPELSLDFYKEQGYHPAAVREYLLTILNSNYEEWRMENPTVPCEDFPFSLEKMSTSGALFDLNKLNDVSKDTLVKIPADQLASFLIEWASKYNNQVYSLINGRETYIASILDLGRQGDKPRKDLVSASQIFQFISYFFDETFQISEEVPVETSPEDVAEILAKYLESYDHSDDQSQWFDKIRAIGEELGYAAKPKDFKKNPDQFKGHVGHVSTVIRIALVGRSQSPDLWEIQQILGEEKTKKRLAQFKA